MVKKVRNQRTVLSLLIIIISSKFKLIRLGRNLGVER